MGFLNKINNSNFLIRLRSWEYWPMELVYIPVMFYWIWLAFKARSPFYFAASNPGIEYGGMLGESKVKILEKIDPKLKPITLYFERNTNPESVLKKIEEAGLKFPLIFKPDIGERGLMVERIENESSAEEYMRTVKVHFLVQEYVNLPIELGVFYFRYPDSSQGEITSITIKEFLKVKGDGQSTMEQLILKSPRAKLQLKELRVRYSSELDTVLKVGEEKMLVPLGNHCKGATFLDGNKHITAEMTRSFDQIASKIEGFYIGRFDLKCNTWDDLEQGHIKIWN